MTAAGTWTAVLVLAVLTAAALLTVLGFVIANVQRNNRRYS